MTITVHYYGLLAERLDMASEDISLEIDREAFDLRQYFEDLHPELKNTSYQIAVNQELTNTVEPATTIQEIALLPPFAGG